MVQRTSSFNKPAEKIENQNASSSQRGIAVRSLQTSRDVPTVSQPLNIKHKKKPAFVVPSVKKDFSRTSKRFLDDDQPAGTMKSLSKEITFPKARRGPKEPITAPENQLAVSSSSSRVSSVASSEHSSASSTSHSTPVKEKPSETTDERLHKVAEKLRETELGAVGGEISKRDEDEQQTSKVVSLSQPISGSSSRLSETDTKKITGSKATMFYERTKKRVKKIVTKEKETSPKKRMQELEKLQNKKKLLIKEIDFYESTMLLDFAYERYHQLSISAAEMGKHYKHYDQIVFDVLEKACFFKLEDTKNVVPNEDANPLQTFNFYKGFWHAGVTSPTPVKGGNIFKKVIKLLGKGAAIKIVEIQQEVDTLEGKIQRLKLQIREDASKEERDSFQQWICEPIVVNLTNRTEIQEKLEIQKNKICKLVKIIEDLKQQLANKECIIQEQIKHSTDSSKDYLDRAAMAHEIAALRGQIQYYEAEQIKRTAFSLSLQENLAELDLEDM